MGLPFRLQEHGRALSPRRMPFPAGGQAPILPGGAGGILLEGMDPYTGAGEPTFCWDVDDNGWDEGHWYGQWERLSCRLFGSLTLRRGTGDASFSRPSTTTRTNEDGDSETVAADAAAFDWLAAPSATERYCLRANQADALLTFPTARNLLRRRGAITVWVRPTWPGTPAEGSDRILFECGDWKLWKPSGTTEIRWQVPLVDGTLETAAYSVSAWSANTWHLVGASWDRTAGEITLWTDGELRDTEGTLLRYAELGDSFGLGQGVAAGSPITAYLLDWRMWPLPLTETLFETLYAVQV